MHKAKMKSLLSDGKTFHKFWKQPHSVKLLKFKLVSKHYHLPALQL